MKVEDIVKGLKDAGYQVKKVETVKNGVKLCGICFSEDNDICPVVYTDDIVRESGSIPEAVEKVLEVYHNVEPVAIDKNKISDSNFIMQNVYIGLQKESNEELVKKETAFEGIEQYLYVRIDSRMIFKLTPDMVARLDGEEMWKSALAHTSAETQIISLAEIFAMAGPENTNGSPMAYIVTTTTGIKGASAILDMKALKRLAQSLGIHKFIVLPSSVHEMIVVFGEETDDLSQFAEMVKDINQSHVIPEDRLTDRAYVLEV